MEQDKQCGEEYVLLLQYFNRYKYQSIYEKDKLRKEVARCRTLLEKFTDKVEKRFDARIVEERTQCASQIDRVYKYAAREEETYKEILQNKERVLDELRYTIRRLEGEKKSIIEMNTKMLLDITRDLEMSGQGESDQSHSYNELLRMYKYLLEENDGLKKELLLLQRGQRDREREEGKSKKESKAERKQKLNESETEKHRNREKDQDKDKGTKKLNRK